MKVPGWYTFHYVLSGLQMLCNSVKVFWLQIRETNSGQYGQKINVLGYRIAYGTNRKAGEQILETSKNQSQDNASRI